MLKSGQNRPISSGKVTKILKDDEWRRFENEVTLSANEDGCLNFSVDGGSDNGQFACISELVQSKVNYKSGTLNEGDIILEVQGQKVAGYTQRDVVAWLNHCCKNGNPVVLKTISPGHITKDLREFLNTRFQKGSDNHDLQNIIRDNLYLRTVPVTTREPRENEINGLDYTFLTLEEFMVLDQSGNLLESGIYEGNHYGTPKPSKEPPVSPPQSGGPNSNLNWFMPGAHPSSEGKRKRNRSNVEAMSSKDMEPTPVEIYPSSLPPIDTNVPSNKRSPRTPPLQNRESIAENSQDYSSADLGPLPSNWEKAFTEKGEIYFIE
ncbi:hypothetical protein RUM43_011965 [Polyplax serrata]|uniref:Uncharacterized protein n=1 Tax=Polyplax serrata TaxID=468196 RepID=A0AAN8PU66_POLSC